MALLSCWFSNPTGQSRVYCWDWGVLGDQEGCLRGLGGPNLWSWSLNLIKQAAWRTFTIFFLALTSFASGSNYLLVHIFKSTENQSRKIMKQERAALRAISTQLFLHNLLHLLCFAHSTSCTLNYIFAHNICFLAGLSLHYLYWICICILVSISIFVSITPLFCAVSCVDRSWKERGVISASGEVPACLVFLSHLHLYFYSNLSPYLRFVHTFELWLPRVWGPVLGQEGGGGVISASGEVPACLDHLQWSLPLRHLFVIFGSDFLFSPFLDFSIR